MVDGLTGNRIPLPEQSDGIGVHMLVRNKLVAGKPLTSNPEDPAYQQGEYVLCGIPVDESFPLFVWLEGYEGYESTYTIDSTVSSRSPQAQYDVVRPTPTDLVNIMLFPKGTQTKDLEFVVLNNAAPVAGAQVMLKPSGSNIISWGSAFHPADSLRALPLTATTDDTGVVLFAAADLVLGGQYTWIVVPPDGGQNLTTKASAGTFTVGLRTAVDTTEPYRIHADLGHTMPALVELSRSTDNNDPIASGAVSIFFNRAIELVPNSLDGITATLTGAATAELKENTAGNDATEQVAVTITDNVLTLAPIWKTVPDADPLEEIDLGITYNGVTVRPLASPEQLSTHTVTGATVYMYK
jgi:hypothetical protein